jgi:hypothetical protein
MIEDQIQTLLPGAVSLLPAAGSPFLSAQNPPEFCLQASVSPQALH